MHLCTWEQSKLANTISSWAVRWTVMAVFVMREKFLLRLRVSISNADWQFNSFFSSEEYNICWLTFFKIFADMKCSKNRKLQQRSGAIIILFVPVSEVVFAWWKIVCDRSVHSSKVVVLLKRTEQHSLRVIEMKRECIRNQEFMWIYLRV